MQMRPGRLSLTTLSLFVAVAEEGSLTRAASREAIAPSAASKRLADLEADLNIPLFERSASGMQLTSVGESMLQHAKRMLIASVSLIEDIAEYRAGVRGHIRMLSNLSTILTSLPDDLERFFLERPDLRIELEERPSSGVVKGVSEGWAEIGMCSNDVDLRDLATYPYRSDRLVLVMRQDHPLVRRGPFPYSYALDFRQVGLHRESSIFTRAVIAAREAGRPLQLRIHVPSFDAVCRTVQAGLGIGLMPEPVFRSFGAPIGLHAEDLTDSWAARRLVIVTCKDRQLSAAALLLRDHLCSSAQ